MSSYIRERGRLGFMAWHSALSTPKAVFKLSRAQVYNGWSAVRTRIGGARFLELTNEFPCLVSRERLAGPNGTVAGNDRQCMFERYGYVPTLTCDVKQLGDH